MVLLICVDGVICVVGVVPPKVVILLIFKIILGLHHRHHYHNIVVIIVSGLSGRLNQSANKSLDLILARLCLVRFPLHLCRVGRGKLTRLGPAALCPLAMIQEMCKFGHIDDFAFSTHLMQNEPCNTCLRLRVWKMSATGSLETESQLKTTKCQR